MPDRDYQYINRTAKGTITRLFADHVSSSKTAFFQMAGIDFIPGRRDGPYIYDVEGKNKLINCHCNGGVFNLGHRNSEIIKTLNASMQELDIGNHHLISEHRAMLAAKLAGLMPGGINRTVFGVSGGEAVDLAIKIARGHTGREKIISAQKAYHGHTGLALSTGEEKYYRPFGPPLPGFVKTPFNDINELEKFMDDNTAAVIFETVPATAGMPIPGMDYYSEVRKLCDSMGVLLIIDEIQTGLGRTGKFWGIEHYNTVPDIIITGKGLSGGIFPMTATSFKKELESVFQRDPFLHISTFGGAELGCPVAMKVLDISSEKSFLENVKYLANLFHNGFSELKAKYPDILTGFRQLGLMMGIELAGEDLGPFFTKLGFDNGLLAIYANNDPHVVQLLPPLIIDGTMANEILNRIDSTLQSLQGILKNQ